MFLLLPPPLLLLLLLPPLLLLLLPLLLLPLLLLLLLCTYTATAVPTRCIATRRLCLRCGAVPCRATLLGRDTPQTDTCNTTPIVVQASAPGLGQVQASISVSVDVSADGVMAAAKATAEEFADGFSYLDDFVG